MALYKPGIRVFAVLSATSDVVQFLGFGTYVGDEIPPNKSDQFSQTEMDMATKAIRDTDERLADVDWWPLWEKEIEAGKMTREEAERKYQEGQERRARPIEVRAKELLLEAARNPKIELDNGDVVWGYQCWWAPEERWDEWCLDREVVDAYIGRQSESTA